MRINTITWLSSNTVCIVLCLLMQKIYTAADFQGAFIWSCKALVTEVKH